MEKTLQKIDTKKYGLGIVFDWTGADLEHRTFGGVEEHEIRIPANTTADEPVVIIFDQKNLNSKICIQVDVGANSQVSFFHKIDVQEYCELTVDVHVYEGAKVEYTIVQSAHANGYLASAYRGVVEKNASLTWFDTEFGGKIVSADIETTLIGDGAIGNTFGLFLGSQAQAFDIHHRTNHQAAHTTSLMESKGILDDAAKAVYRGLIHIPKGIAGSTGFERSNTLLFSKQAHISAIPELEIGNNDVKCGHASTITRIDKEKLFYFQSRGISANDAVRECALGHARAITQKINNEKIRYEIDQLIEKKLI